MAGEAREQLCLVSVVVKQEMQTLTPACCSTTPNRSEDLPGSWAGNAVTETAGSLSRGLQFLLLLPPQPSGLIL